MFEEASEFLYDQWIPMWEAFLGKVEPHLPEHLHWNELCWTFVFYLNEIRLWIHRNTSGLENWEIVTNTVTYCFYVFLLLEVLRRIIPVVFFNDDGFINMLKKKAFKVARKLPVIGPKIQDAIDDAMKQIEETGFQVNGNEYVKKLPFNGMSKDNVMKEIKTYEDIGGCAWKEGYVSGAVYSDGALTELMTEVYRKYLWANPLHPDVFPDVRKMEAEVVRMVINLFHGDDECCGLMTSGGSESIMMAVKCYRELGRERGIEKPEIVAPYSVHPAFDKGCNYFGMKITHVPVDKKTGRADTKAMERAISKRTILLVGSVPSYPHGCIDDMVELSRIAKKRNLYLHADACLGGFIVAFMKQAGYDLPPFDFRLPGITSISCDTHKYGYTPKGSSVVMYRSKDIRKHQYFTQANWSGGVYAAASFPGSRPGNTVATTWACMMHLGEKGYVERTKLVVKTARYIGERIAGIPGIRLMANVDVCIVSFTSDVFDIFLMSDDLAKKGWHLNPLQFPSGLHIAVTLNHTKPGVADRFLSDIKSVAQVLMKNPGQKAEGKGAIYGLSQQIPDRSIISDITTGFLDTYYSVTAGLKK